MYSEYVPNMDSTKFADEISQLDHTYRGKRSLRLLVCYWSIHSLHFQAEKRSSMLTLRIKAQPPRLCSYALPLRVASVAWQEAEEICIHVDNSRV